jgi:hypothetical protein
MVGSSKPPAGRTVCDAYVSRSVASGRVRQLSKRTGWLGAYLFPSRCGRVAVCSYSMKDIGASQLGSYYLSLKWDRGVEHVIRQLPLSGKLLSSDRRMLCLNRGVRCVTEGYSGLRVHRRVAFWIRHVTRGGRHRR